MLTDAADSDNNQLNTAFVLMTHVFQHNFLGLRLGKMIDQKVAGNILCRTESV